jgi:hypothetical protein
VSMKDFVEQFDFSKKRLSRNRRRSLGGHKVGGETAQCRSVSENRLFFRKRRDLNVF